MITKWKALAVLPLIATLGLAACATPTQGESASLTDSSWNEGGSITIDSPEKVEDFQIAFIGFGKDNPWSQFGFEALKSEAEAFGAEATFVGPASFDPQAQYQLVSDLAISKQYDMIVLVAADGPSIVPAVEQAIAAGIIVVPMNMAVGPDPLATEPQVKGVETQVLENLELNASAMADGVIAACEGVDNCEVGVLWGVRALAFDSVKPEIFQKQIAKHANISVVCESDAAYTQDLGRTQSTDCLQAHPNLNVIAAQADESARGAESSIVEAGKTFGIEKGDIKIVSSYGSRYGVEQVRNGKWLSTTYNRVGSMGKAAVRLGLLQSQGKTVPNYVQMEELDGLPLVLTSEVLKDHPEVLGQWEG